MKRKLIQLAGKTMVVSIPTSFVKKYNLKKSEEVEVTDNNGQITISTNKNIGNSKTIEVEDSTIIGDRINIFYSCGFDQIRIKVTKKDSIKNIQKMLTNSNLDYELFVTSNTSCILQSIRNIDVEQFDNILKRVFFMLTLEEKMPTVQINKLLNILKRILHKRGYKDHNSTLLMGDLIFALKQLLQISSDIPYSREIYSLFYSYSTGLQQDIEEQLISLKKSVQKNLLASLFGVIISLNMLNKEESKIPAMF